MQRKSKTSRFIHQTKLSISHLPDRGPQRPKSNPTEFPLPNSPYCIRVNPNAVFHDFGYQAACYGTQSPPENAISSDLDHVSSSLCPESCWTQAFTNFIKLFHSSLIPPFLNILFATHGVAPKEIIHNTVKIFSNITLHARGC
jgi:hypothetical protein